jgi:hypothetical protein
MLAAILAAFTMIKNRIIIYFLLLFLLPSIAFGQNIKGSALDVQRNKPITFAIITLLSDQNIKYVEYTNERGEFEFKNIQPGRYTLQFEAIGFKDTTFFNLPMLKDTSLQLNYIRNCNFDKSIKDKSCPTCKKKNNVIPIIYGLPYSKNGEDPTKGNGKKFVLAGCEITDCDPNWYCRKDKTKF